MDDRSPLRERIRSIIEVNLALKDEETLLVVTDDETYDIGRAFYDVACDMGARASMALMPVGRVNGEEPPAAVAAAMKAADVVVCPTVKSLTHTNARIEAAAAGSRVVTMPGITASMLQSGASCADYATVEQRTTKMAELLTNASHARIEKDGHVLELDLRGRRGMSSPGVYRNPGDCGNFPSGEAYIAPVEGGVDGSMLIDGSMVGIGVLSEPLEVEIRRGVLTNVSGCDEAGPYRSRLDVLFATPENATVAELGVGTNDAAVLSGIILEDEKLHGSVHIAFGTNTSFGGVTKADCHYDGIILRPMLYLDDVCVMRAGEPLF